MEKQQRRADTGEKPYICHICGKMFSQPHKLTRHERTHTGEKPYKCNICGKTFSQSCMLTRHNKTHTGEKPYKCDLCDKAFSELHHVNLHRRTHNDERPYKCNICGKTFSQSSSLTRHKKTHTDERPYKCFLCDKAFSELQHVNQHRRTHSDERPYKCNICWKTFLRSERLINHRKTHTGEKPYKCTIRDKTFLESGNRSQHMKTSSKQTVINISPSSIEERSHRSSNSYGIPVFEREFSSLVECEAKSECPTCRCLFQSEFMLNNHLELHRKTDREFENTSCGWRAFAYSCGSCFDSFDSKKEVFSHFNVHLEFHDDDDEKYFDINRKMGRIKKDSRAEIRKRYRDKKMSLNDDYLEKKKKDGTEIGKHGT